MRTYESKEALIEAIQIASQKYLAEFAEIPETLKDHRIETVAKTPSENLAYQLGWLNLLLSWEEQEQRGLTVQTPAEGYKWNQLGASLSIILSNLWTNEFRKSADCVARHLRKITSLD